MLMANTKYKLSQVNASRNEKKISIMYVACSDYMDKYHNHYH